MVKRVWCTGAEKGLGRLIVLKLAAEGHHVACSARTAQDLEPVIEEAVTLPGKLVPFVLDVTDQDDVFMTVDGIEAALGDLDLVILNIGTRIAVDASSLSIHAFRDVMETNFMGVVYGLAALLPRFVERGHGHVAVVTSVVGYRGLPQAAAYGASNAALVNMCEALKPELDEAGVTISVVNSGFLKTPLTDRNKFRMPFLMDVEDAAKQVVRGLDTARFEIAVPKRHTWMMKVLRCLPSRLAFLIAQKIASKTPS